MSSSRGGATETIDLNGIKVDFETVGTGRDILYLQGGAWFAEEAPFCEHLSRLGRVIMPVHPDFGAHAAPTQFTSADDLAYLYLDLIKRLALRNVIVVGASFGGWIGAEIATKSCEHISGLVLIDPFGIKVSDRETRDIVDIFATADPDLVELAWRDATGFNHKLSDVTDVELMRRVRARNGLARYGWQPYMHNPKLRGRLHRISAPSAFVWGAQDGIVAPAYGRAFAALVPGATFALIEGAGHFPHVEKPAEVMRVIASIAAREPAKS